MLRNKHSEDMLVNSSASSDSFLHLNLSFVNSDVFIYIYCIMSRPGRFIFTSYVITNIILFIPLSIFIVYHGLQQWRQKRSTSSAAIMSHSDCFTYHMVSIELIGLVGCILCCCGIYSDHLVTITVGYFVSSFIWFGEMFFHVLTCVERYLAVVHPIIYLSLRKERGIRMRNISIGCVWLLCFVGTVLLMTQNVSVTVYFFLLILSLTIVSFCSLSVLRVLIRPGPGEQGGDRERVDQSKQRAFYTITAILGVLVLRFVWSLALCVLFLLDGDSHCVIMAMGSWVILPSALVLPLLFLHRAGRLSCCKNDVQR